MERLFLYPITKVVNLIFYQKRKLVLKKTSFIADRNLKTSWKYIIHVKNLDFK
jgi:hypothetical protein